MLAVLREEDLALGAEQAAPDHVVLDEPRPVHLAALGVVILPPVLSEVRVRVRLASRLAIKLHIGVGEADGDAAALAGVDDGDLEVVQRAPARHGKVRADRAEVMRVVALADVPHRRLVLANHEVARAGDGVELGRQRNLIVRLRHPVPRLNALPRALVRGARAHRAACHQASAARTAKQASRDVAICCAAALACAPALAAPRPALESVRCA